MNPLQTITKNQFRYANLRRALMVVALLAAMLATAPAQAVLVEFGPTDVPSPPGRGFPLCYLASDGMGLELCLDELAENANVPGNSLCLLDRVLGTQTAARIPCQDD